jgi:phospholipid/cholesterol/gamma-HCH transport system substrate-binding protein
MKKELKLGIFVLIVFIVFAYFIIKTDSLISVLSKGNTYVVYGKFSNVSGLFESAPVRLSGVRIGTVADVFLEEDKAVVKMLIRKKITITSDARASVATTGLVGESFIEIVYKDEFKTDNPIVIPPKGEIKTITKLGLEEIGEVFKSFSPKIETLLDSMNRVLGNRNSQESIEATLDNLKVISANIKDITGKDGAAGKAVAKVDKMADRLKKTLDTLNKFVENLDQALYKEDEGIAGNLETAAKQLKSITEDLKRIVTRVDKGEGTAGKLLTDDGLYKKVDKSIDSVNSLLKDLEKKKDNLNKTTLNYYAGVDYYTGDEDGTRFSFGLNLDFSKFTLFTRVREDAFDGDPYYTVMAGKRYKNFSVAAGMVDSGLGAALYLNLFNRKLNLELEASRFYRGNNPVLKAVLSFSLSKNIDLTAGYEDLLEKDFRKFLVGVAFKN